MMKNKMMIKTTTSTNLLVAVILMVSLGCEDSNQLPDRNYQLVWEDEFSGITGDLPDPSVWSFDIGTGDNGWGNQELQYYTDRPENVSLDGEGNLVITAIEESFEGSNFTSARITTRDTREYQYGRIEARLKTPFGQGLWPAFWMLGNDINQGENLSPADTVPWPRAGEIDLMELRGQEPSINSGSIHGPGYSAGDAVTDEFQLIDGRFDTEFHVFAIEWGPDFIDFFVDDRLYQQLSPSDIPEDSEWVFDKEYYMLLNVAVGGSFVGSPTENTRFPQTMIVDYVRVFEQTN